MEKEFVPYELAVKLKELGFKEECFGTWWYRPDIHKIGEEELDCKLTKYFELPEYQILAPLWQQAFDWFREKHNLYSYINLTNIQGEMLYHVIICKVNEFEIGLSKVVVCNLFNFTTYEEARLECLKKLIELVKN